MCDCVKRINEQMAPHRIRVSQSIQITGAMNMVARTVVATEAVTLGERKPRKAPVLLASFCPFCGEKVVVPE